MSDQVLKEAKLRGDTLHLDLWYPGIEGNARYIELGLMHVRAADNIRISYDFDRDGWKIEQASRFYWTSEDDARDWDWAEVAFVQAWGRKETPEQVKARIGLQSWLKDGLEPMFGIRRRRARPASVTITITDLRKPPEREFGAIDCIVLPARNVTIIA